MPPYSCLHPAHRRQMFRAHPPQLCMLPMQLGCSDHRACKGSWPSRNVPSWVVTYTLLVVAPGACPAPSWVTAKLCKAQARSELIRATITENQLARTQPHQCNIQPSSPSWVLPKEKPPRWATAGALSACPGSAGTL